jgi:hypothetical protein
MLSCNLDHRSHTVLMDSLLAWPLPSTSENIPIVWGSISMPLFPGNATSVRNVFRLDLWSRYRLGLTSQDA